MSAEIASRFHRHAFDGELVLEESQGLLHLLRRETVGTLEPLGGHRPGLQLPPEFPGQLLHLLHFPQGLQFFLARARFFSFFYMFFYMFFYISMCVKFLYIGL